ncbi:MAG: homoserine dehydrogenase [Coriobacteriia bacterium]|nr:homoserine dehydrogenase [Coriobacteriia bacterium]
MTIKVGLIGLGTVGGGVVDIFASHRDDFARRLGIEVELAMCADRTSARFAQLGLDAAICTTDAFEVVDNEELDIVIELIGGTTIARDLIVRALESGRNVVTANKALMATDGKELFALADQNGCDVRFEASVGGGIPIIEPLKRSLIANEITQVMGILNGTTNYILTAMTRDGLAYDKALMQAQELGYAEADPTADVEGHDAAAKIAILASIAFNSHLTLDQVPVKGISHITLDDIEMARANDAVIKLLGVAKRTTAGIEIFVRPVMVPTKHQLAAVNDAYNAIYVTGDAVGDLMFYGAGAGAGAAASAVMGDVLEMARDLAHGNAPLGCSCTDNLPVLGTDLSDLLVPLNSLG